MEYNPPYGSTDPDAPYVDRSTPSGIQGSKVPAKAVEHPQREIVAVIEGAGMVPDGNRTDQLWEALQRLLTGFPIYPDCRSSNGTFDLTSPSPGTIRIPAGVEWVIRGGVRRETVVTNLFTQAAKTYHVRWDAENGFRILDLASVGYNPTSAAEADAAFDSSYDDMLVARVVTDGSNVATITNLVNRPVLKKQVRIEKALGSQLNWATLNDSGVSLNWARSPDWAEPVWQGFRSFLEGPDGTEHDLPAGILRALEIRKTTVSRYAAGNLEYWYEDDALNNGYLVFVWAISAP